MNKLILKVLIICLITISINAKDEIFYFPKDASFVEAKILSLIKKSKSNIVISMYNFSHKKFAKALVKAKKRGIDVVLYLDASKVKKDNKLYKLFIKKGIKTTLIKNKLHTKLALFDDTTLVTGSINFTKETFKKNYELVIFTKNKEFIIKTKVFIKNSLKI